VIQLAREEARDYLLGHLGLRRAVHRDPVALLGALRMIQLDPLDAIGTNVDLVAFARVDGLGRGDVFRAVYPHHAFEHWAKERCLLPAAAFPWYRSRAQEASWWSHEERQRRLPEGVLEEARDGRRAGVAGGVPPLGRARTRRRGRAVVAQRVALDVVRPRRREEARRR
jgi:uncharacterized protein YcaQ